MGARFQIQVERLFATRLAAWAVGLPFEGARSLTLAPRGLLWKPVLLIRSWRLAASDRIASIRIIAADGEKKDLNQSRGVEK